MAANQQVRIPDAWRVVVVTMIPGGVVYTMVADVLRPLGHRVVGVLTSPGPAHRRNTSYREVVAAVPPEIDVIVSAHPARWAAMLAPLRPDLIICGGMPWRLPPAVLALPRLGAINIHPALLPRHRGPAAIQWAFRSGDPTLGITIHRIAPDFDTGPILAQTAVPIDDEDDFQTLLAKVGPVIPGLLGQALDRVAQGDPGDPQDEARATYAGLFEEAWRTIRWDAPARAIHNQVRSWGGFGAEGALGEVAGTPLQIRKTRLLPAAPPDELTPPGTLLRQEGEEWIVQCGDGPIALVEWGRLSDT
jgi:methionyl-tRNA formyltransferase